MDVLTDLIYVLITENMDQEQRDKFESTLDDIRYEVDPEEEAREERRRFLVESMKAQMS